MEFSTKVALKLLLEGAQDGSNKNMVTSPLSYNAVMNMVAAGSSGNTLDQILQFLERSSIEEVNSESSKFTQITTQQTIDTSKSKIYIENRPIVTSLNGVWLDQKYVLKDSFKELVENQYGAKVRVFDSLEPKIVVEETNEWASESTKGLIKEVLEEKHITPRTVLILGNALYFKGLWEEEFSTYCTKNLPFYLLNGEKIEVPFMTGSYSYSHKTFQDLQVVRIPFRAGGDVNRKFAMYIFLPYEKDGLENLLKKANSDPEFFTQHCDVPRGKFVDEFYIPKFKFSYGTEAGAKIMKNMGLTLPFDEEKAEFDEMIANGEIFKYEERLHVAGIVQKAFIEVNEHGTEAAAVTFLRMRGGGCPPSTGKKFIADHPFLFVIQEENSGTLLFSGTVLNPRHA